MRVSDALRALRYDDDGDPIGDLDPPGAHVSDDDVDVGVCTDCEAGTCPYDSDDYSDDYDDDDEEEEPDDADPQGEADPTNDQPDTDPTDPDDDDPDDDEEDRIVRSTNRDLTPLGAFERRPFTAAAAGAVRGGYPGLGGFEYR